MKAHLKEQKKVVTSDEHLAAMKVNN
jgi:hypothetical protein